MTTARPFRSAWKSLWKKSLSRRPGGFKASMPEALECRMLPAATVITASVDGYVRDANRDGVFTVVDSTGANILTRSTTGTNVGFERGILEFDLSTISTALSVNTATLVLNVSQFTKDGVIFPKMDVYGYTGDGTVTTADGSVAATQIGTTTVSATGELRITLDTAFVRSQGGNFLGIRLENPVLNGPFGIYSAIESAAADPTLELDLALTVADKSFNVDEQRPNGTIVGEAGIGNNATYTVLSGDPGGVFNFNATTGRITVADSSQLKFALQQQYVLEIEATLPDGTTGVYDVIINVKNVFGPNNPPVVTSSQFTIEEFSPVGTVVGTVQAVDPDSADPLSYALVGGNVGNAFQINSTTGQITVANQSVLSLRGQTSYVLDVQVKDTRSPRNTVVQRMEVFLTPRATTAVSPNSVQVVPAVDGELRDLNNDGVFESMNLTQNVNRIQKAGPGVIGRRPVMEFDLSGISSAKIVKSAFLTIYVSGNVGNSFPIDVFGYVGNGVITGPDAVAGSLIGSRLISVNTAGDLKAYTIELDRTLIQQLIGTSNDLGIVLRNDANMNGINIDSVEGPGNLGNSPARRPSLNLIMDDLADDVVLNNTTNQAVTVGRSNGTSFTTSAAGALRQGVTFSELLTGDFNGDGRVDIAGRNSANGQMLVALATVNQFVTGAAWTTFSTVTTFSDVLVGDFNGDGRDDIVGRSAQGQLLVAQSTGTKFNNIVYETLPTALRSQTNVRVGDYNGDGRDDLMGIVAATGEVVVAISNGNTFTSSVWGTVPVGTTISEVNAGDFTGDGRDDVVMRQGAGNLVVLRSTGTAFQSVLFGVVPAGVPYIGFRTGDFNGDGLEDLAGFTGTGATTIFRSNGFNFVLANGGTIQTPTLVQPVTPGGLATFTASDVVVGDFNRDGKTDILVRKSVTTQVNNLPVTTQQLWVAAGSNAGPFSSTLFATINNAGPFTLLGVGNF